MVHTTLINGIEVKTGDLVCTTDGGVSFVAGQFWRVVGKLVPGAVDHVAIYIGPGGRCVEAGANGRVIEFEVPDGWWDAEKMREKRKVVDTLYGIAYPLATRPLTTAEQNEIREGVAGYCLAQVEAAKPYNLNFFDSRTETAFYCSQLAYRAYQLHGIDLNTGLGLSGIPGSENIIFPQELWYGCAHKRSMG